MKIEIWSDYVCPFCYMGKRQLEDALSQLTENNNIDIEFKSYQLDPSTPPYTGQNFYESMAGKFGGVERSKQMMAGIAEQAKTAGLDFHFDTMKPTNTLDAHRLTKFARDHGKEAAIAEKLMYANFTESKDVGNMETLAALAKEVGLNKDDTLAILKDKQAYAEEVYADIAEAKQLGVTSVPFFLINRKYTLSGAQSTESFIQALNKVLKEEKTAPVFENLSKNDNPDAVCGEDGCAVPDEEE